MGVAGLENAKAEPRSTDRRTPGTLRRNESKVTSNSKKNVKAKGGKKK